MTSGKYALEHAETKKGGKGGFLPLFRQKTFDVRIILAKKNVG